MEIASSLQERERKDAPRTLSDISIASNSSAKGQAHPNFGGSMHVRDTRVKLMCGYGGKILPRPSDRKLRYVGGETRMVSVPRHIHYTTLLKKLEDIYGDGITMKYQLPEEDLDALVSVSSEEDVENMMEECDRLEGGSARLRVFVFSSAEDDALDLSVLVDPKVSEQRYVDAVNTVQVEAGLRKSGDYGVAAPFGYAFRDLESGGGSAASSVSSQHDLYNWDPATHRGVLSSQMHQHLDVSRFGDGEDLVKRLELPDMEDGRRTKGALGNKVSAPVTSVVAPTRQFSDLLLSPGAMLQKQLQADEDLWSSHALPAPPIQGQQPDHSLMSSHLSPLTPPPPPTLLLEPQHIGRTSTGLFITPTLDSPLANEHTGFGILHTQPFQPTEVHELSGRYSNVALPANSNVALPANSNVALPANSVPSALSIRQSDAIEKQDQFLEQTKLHESSFDFPSGFSELDYARTMYNHGAREADKLSAFASQPFSHQECNATFQTSDVSPFSKDEMDEFLQQALSQTSSFSNDGASWHDSGYGITSQAPWQSPDLSLQLGRHRNGAGEGIVSQRSTKSEPKSSSLSITNQAVRNRVIQDYEGFEVAELSLAAGARAEPSLEGNASFSLHKSSMPAVVSSLHGAYAVAIDAKEEPGIETNEKRGTQEAVPSSFPAAPLHVEAWSTTPVLEHQPLPSALQPLGQEEGPEEPELGHTSEKEDGKSEDDEVDIFQSAADMSFSPAAAAEVEAIAHGLQIIRNCDLEELRELGSGTFGTVFHGKWRGTDVAIKRIKSSCFMGRPAERERLIADFWREACILGQLHHPNVVAFYGVVPDGPGGTLATVTEYMVNGSLKQALQKKDRVLDRRKRLLIAMDAAFGMEYLHGRNVIHFDLKGENLLVNLRDIHRPICKVGDLGLSKVKQQTMVSGGVRGTLPWMAPELLNGSSSLVSEKVDVFSFGIVLWELLTGEEPYASMHYGAIIGGIVSNTLRPLVPRWCDAEWKFLMEACWSADPAQRPKFSDIARSLRAMEATFKANK